MGENSDLRLHRLLRWPPLHFVLVGAVLFAGQAALQNDGSRTAGDRLRIEVSDRQVRALVAQHEARFGQPADLATVQGLVDRFVEEEILYREAIRIGLATDNPAVTLRLRQKLEFVGEGHAEEMADTEVLQEAAALGLAEGDIVLRNMFVRNMRLLLGRQGDRPPTEEELESHLQRHAEEFRLPARVSWHHVLLAKKQSGQDLRSAAGALLKELRREGLSPELVNALGDPFAGGHVFGGMTRDRIETRFGGPFADAVLSLPEAQWSEPVASPFGLHLVWVDQHVPDRVPRLDEVRDRVALSWRGEQRKAHLKKTVEALRSRYDVVVAENSTTEAQSG